MTQLSPKNIIGSERLILQFCRNSIILHASTWQDFLLLIFTSYQRYSNQYICGKFAKSVDFLGCLSKNSDSEVLGGSQEFVFQTDAPGDPHTGDPGITL